MSRLLSDVADEPHETEEQREGAEQECDQQPVHRQNPPRAGHAAFRITQGSRRRIRTGSNREGPASGEYQDGDHPRGLPRWTGPRRTGPRAPAAAAQAAGGV